MEAKGRSFSDKTERKRETTERLNKREQRRKKAPTYAHAGLAELRGRCAKGGRRRH